jgi:multidrug efflux pump subunit AcrA (membrane-fusion protein)
MFIRATVELAHQTDAVIVPEQAITQRGDEDGVFVVNEAEMTVAWRPVTVGIREEGRVQVEGQGIGGRVVVLGQQLIDDGAAILVPSDQARVAPDAGQRGKDRK